jgi:H+-translocating NAD(P) transhydrogenase subunit alpha
MSDTMLGVYVFVLSCFVGYHVVWGVTPALHTPLMAVTNAISAIVVVGAILVAGAGSTGFHFGWIEILGFLAVTLASINIFGGFVVTNRMLSMFKKKK